MGGRQHFCYDYCYMPCSFETGLGKGFAFVNFMTAEETSAFIIAWHGTRRLGMPSSGPALNISFAAVQGKAANLSKWDSRRMRRVRNPQLRPFVLDHATAAGPPATSQEQAVFQLNTGSTQQEGTVA